MHPVFPAPRLEIMKKMILAVALLLTGIVSAQADGREKPITIDNLPKAAQEFLATYFKDLTVAYAVEESKYFGSEYEVTYTDRTEVEFRADGRRSIVNIRPFLRRSFPSRSRIS